MIDWRVMPDTDKAPSQETAYDTSQPFLERVLAAVEQTREPGSPYIRYNPDGSYRELWDGPKRDSSDTIGTKADLHWQARTFEAAAQDAFAMNANDLYRDRAVPYKLLNTLMIESEDGDAIARIAERLSELSVERGIQMGDGETAILNTMDGFELDVAMTGAVVDESPNAYRPGDVLVGIPSSGIHSNGLSDARRLFDHACPPELLTPTRIYDEVPELLQQYEVHGMTHVTGGGLSKLRTEGLDVQVTNTHPTSTSSADVFYELFDRWAHESGDRAFADRQMHLKFNNGIGFVLGAQPSEAVRLLGVLPDARAIGEVGAGSGTVRVAASRYTGQTVEL